MSTVFLFGLSAIACRNFLLYYWRALTVTERVSAGAG